MTLILNKSDVQSVLNMKDCIEVVEKAFGELSKGTAVLPLRTNITSPYGLSLYMPAYLKDMGALACKVVTVNKNNPDRFNLPIIMGKVFMQDPETGDIICIMDGTVLTAVRTGAASGVATNYLSRKGKNLTAGMVGAGVQARMQLEAVATVRDISQAYVFDISEEATRLFIDEMGKKLNMEIIKTESPDEIVKADIICTSTTSPTPLFDGKKVKEGTHINGIVSHTPDARELDTEIILRSKVVGDSKTACFNEAGDIIIPLNEGAMDESHFYAELGDIVTGEKKGRVNDKEITIFKSNGLAIQDAATAKLVYEKAVEKGIGTHIDI